MTTQILNMPGKVSNIDGLLGQAREAARCNEDVEGTIGDLRFTSPTSAEFQGTRVELSRTAKSQLGTIFGVKWDKWFGSIDGGTVHSEIRKRIDLSGNTDTEKSPKKFRLRKQDGVCMLRAVLSQSYTPIDDYPLLSNILSSQALRGMLVDSDVRVLSNPWRVTECDAPTNVTLLMNLPIDIQHGEVTDRYYPGFHVGNSEVGNQAVIIEDALIRVVCVNGLLRIIDRQGLLRRLHRRIDYTEFNSDLLAAAERIRQGVASIPDRLTSSQAVTLDVQGWDGRVAAFIRANELPKTFEERVTAAYQFDPERTMFGLIQAITRAAHKLPIEHAILVERAAAGLLN